MTIDSRTDLVEFRAVFSFARVRGCDIPPRTRIGRLELTNWTSCIDVAIVLTIDIFVELEFYVYVHKIVHIFVYCV